MPKLKEFDKKYKPEIRRYYSNLSEIRFQTNSASTLNHLKLISVHGSNLDNQYWNRLLNLKW